jgi:hypothetical protein
VVQEAVVINQAEQQRTHELAVDAVAAAADHAIGDNFSLESLYSGDAEVESCL